MAETEQYGPNKPLSLDPPSKRDLELNESLLAELKAQKNFESAEESKKRLVQDIRYGQRMRSRLSQGGSA